MTVLTPRLVAYAFDTRTYSQSILHRYLTDSQQRMRLKWRAVKDLLHPVTCQTISTADEDKSRATRSATFFSDKVITIKAAISLKQYGVTPDPLRDDKPFRGQALLNLLPVTEEEVLKLLSSLSGKSSPRDFIPTSLLKHCGGAYATIITI